MPTRTKLPLDRGPVIILTPDHASELRLTLLENRHGEHALLVESDAEVLWTPAGRVEPRRPRRLAKHAGGD